MKTEELNKQIQQAEEAMYKAMRVYRPRKDVNPEYPGEKDRDVEMKGKAAKEIAHYEYLMRQWEARNEG